MVWLDRLVAGMLAPLAVWVLVSGLDDLFLDLSAIYFRFSAWWRRKKGQSADRASRAVITEKRIALMIPAWREDAVIERMLDHNIAAIRYSNYEIFIGTYPNDLRTAARVQACEQKYRHVHGVRCPHPGPTSKADCLNWIYRGIQAFEERNKCRFEVFLHHDAEDLIHPRSLEWINGYCEDYEMVQVPVLPLPTPWWEFTHGTYCDEFAQSHLRELHVRQRLGGFLPSCGVGTAYRRRVLERLEWNNGGRLFRPASLTEDYQIGLDLHRLGCSQILLDARELAQGGAIAATREYFPRRARQAIRQKARWVTGIGLQSWQEAGWNAGPGQVYWLWRDRKGLVGNPLTILANVLFLYGVARWVWAQASGQPWQLGVALTMLPGMWGMLAFNTGLIGVRLVSRASSVLPVYGWRHALVCPMRSVWGNIINFAATVRAFGLFAGAQLRRRPPEWLKTEHSYPTRRTLMPQKRRLGEVLAEMGLLPAAEVENGLRALAPGQRLGEYLVARGMVSEENVYAGLAIQQDLPFEPVEAELVEEGAVRLVPEEMARRLKVVPVRVAQRRFLRVASPEAPQEETRREIARASGLEARFQLITPTNYGRVREALARRMAAAARG